MKLTKETKVLIIGLGVIGGGYASALEFYIELFEKIRKRVCPDPG